MPAARLRRSPCCMSVTTRPRHAPPVAAWARPCSPSPSTITGCPATRWKSGSDRISPSASPERARHRMMASGGDAVGNDGEPVAIHHHLGHETAAVVAAGHRRAIGPGGAEHGKVARLHGIDSRSRAKVSPVSQIGPTMLAVIRSPVGRTASKSCQASYSAGRARSFIAASTITKGGPLPPRFTRMTRVSRTPALPEITRPGSNMRCTPQPFGHARDHRAVFGRSSAASSSAL